MKLTAIVDKDHPSVLNETDDHDLDLPDTVLDGHGLFVAMMIMVSLTAISLVAITFIDNYKPSAASSISSRLMERTFLEIASRPD